MIQHISISIGFVANTCCRYLNCIINILYVSIAQSGFVLMYLAQGELSLWICLQKQWCGRDVADIHLMLVVLNS